MKSPAGFGAEIQMMQAVLRRAAAAALVGALSYWISTCFVPVKVQETGVVFRWGKVIRPRVQPGMAFKLPWPIDRMVRVETLVIKRLSVGFGADEDAIKNFEEEYGPVDEMENATLMVPYALTGDKNILHLKVILGYRISDPVRYLSRTADADQVLRHLAQQAILTSLSAYPVDRALTTGKLELRNEVASFVARQSAKQGLGLEIVSVEIKKVRPPQQTETAFKAVVNAQEERRQLVHEAMSYRNKVLPEARAAAEQALQEAAAFRTRKIDHARGQVKRFTLLAAEYAKQPKLTRERLRLEALEEILSTADKYVADAGVQSGRVRLRLWQRGNQARRAADDESAGLP